MITIGDARREVRAILARAGIERPGEEASMVIALALGVDRLRLAIERDRALDPAERATIEAIAERRAAREPFAHLRGAQEFWGRDFAIGPGALIPRADSETVIEAAIEAFEGRDPPRRIVDLGTGSGCLLASALAIWPGARGLGIELDLDALAWAARNRRAFGLDRRMELIAGRWLDAIDPEWRFDLALANPPYVRADEIETLEPEVARSEPRLALDGGADGLDAYRAIAPQIAQRLAPDGAAVFEIGASQAAEVSALFAHAGMATTLRRDLADRPRALIARLLRR